MGSRRRDDLGGGYVVLPAAGLYKPISDYDRTTLAKDLSAHLVYGLAMATALRLLAKIDKHARRCAPQ